MEKLNDTRQIGTATYVIERVFNGSKTTQELVTEEIITEAKRVDYVDCSGKKMV